MSDPKPIWPRILALILADPGGGEEQWNKLNSTEIFLKFTFAVSKNLKNPSFGGLLFCFFLGINLQTSMNPLVKLLTVELKL